MSKIFATMLLTFVFPFNSICINDHVLKKLTVNLLTLYQGSGVFGQFICYHGAAFAIPFNLIFNMTMF